MALQTVTIKRHISAGNDIEVAHHMNFDIQTGNDEEQRIEVEQALVHAEKTISLILQFYAVNPATDPKHELTTDDTHGGYLSQVQWQGKTYVKYFGGRWTKYGVNVWPEVLKASGIEASECVNQYSLENHTTTIAYDDNGKPKRVTSIRVNDVPF